MALFSILIFLIFAVFGIALYALFAFALMTMAQKRGIENSWLAFIPIANFYIMGMLIGPFKLGEYYVDKPELYLPLIVLASSVLGQLPLIGSLIGLVSFAAIILAFYYLYKRYIPESAILYAALTILPFIPPFLMFSIKDKEPVELQ